MSGMNKPIQIFKPGKHTAMSGASLEFSESDLQAMVEAYDPAVYDAPIVVGHPKLNAPAYGWVGGLSYADGLVLAEPRDVDPEFAELVSQKKFKKISASLFTPDSPSNPKPGTYYLRHVGFLGAMPPAVKGLKDASFAEGEEGVIEFGDWDDRTIARLFRGIRDWLIGEKGKEVADQVIPDWEVQSLADSAAQPETGNALIPSFSEEPTPKGDEMSAEDKARLEALEAENRQLKEAEAARNREASHKQNVNFADGLVKEGKLLPAQMNVAVATLDLIGSQETPLEFGEGDDKGTLSLDSVKGFFQSLPKQVDFGETSAPGTDDDTGSVSFSAPAGYSVDPLAMEIHTKALAHQKANPGTDYTAAVKAVGG
jgi:hypothetical protein